MLALRGVTKRATAELALRVGGVLQPAMIFMFAAAVTMTAWYRGAMFVWGADHNLPITIQDIGQYFHIVDSGATGPDVRKLPYILPLGAFLWLWNALGFPYDPTAFQVLLLFALLSASGLSMYVLIRTALPDLDRIPALIGAGFYMFNLYALTVIWTPLSNLAFHYGFLPLVLALVFAAFRHASVRLGAAAALVWTLTLTPAYTTTPVAVTDALLFAAVAGYYLARERSPIRRARQLATLGVGAGVWVGLSAFWLLPLIPYWGVTFERGFASGESEPEHLFVANSAPFLDAIRLDGYWGFESGFRGSAYFPWASFYDGLPKALGFVLPALAVLGLVWRGRNGTPGTLQTVHAHLTRAHLVFFAGVWLVALVLMTGAYEPFGDLKLWAAEKLSLLGPYRGVYQRFGVYVALAYAPLIAAGVAVGLGRWAHGHRRSQIGHALCAALAAVVVVVLAWPMWSGQLYDRSGNLASNRINVPAEYEQVASLVDSSSGDHLVLALPFGRDPEVAVEWRNRDDGFRGIEPLHLLSAKPFVLGDPGTPYLTPLVQKVAGGGEQAAFALQLLNARYVVVHRDADRAYLHGRTWIGVDVEAVDRRLARTPGLQLIHAGRHLSVYELITWRPFRVFAVTGASDESILDLPAERLRPLRYSVDEPGNYAVAPGQIGPKSLLVVNYPFDSYWRANGGRPVRVEPGFTGFRNVGNERVAIRHNIARTLPALLGLAGFTLVLALAIIAFPGAERGRLAEVVKAPIVRPPTPARGPSRWRTMPTALAAALHARTAAAPEFAPAVRRARSAAETLSEHGHVLAYALPTAAAFLAAQTWFRPGKVIAGGDLALPAPPPREYRLWNHFMSGEGAPTFDLVGLPYYEAMRFAGWLGLSTGFQWLWLATLFAGAAAASVYFAFAFTRRPLVAGTAGLLATFNAMTLLVPADLAHLAMLIVAGLLGGLIVRAGIREGRGSRPITFALASLGASVACMNPANVFVLLLWLLLSAGIAIAVGGQEAARRTGRFLMVSLPLAAVVNLWWIVPAALALAEPTFESRFAAAGVDPWSLAHGRASVGNVLTLTSAWNWPDPTYYSYGRRDLPISLFRYALPILALLALIVTRGRDRRVAFSLAGAGGIVALVGKGLHPPVSELNRWLYDAVPGYWLLRDPANALVLLALVMTALGALAIPRLLAGETMPRGIGAFLAFTLVAGTIIFAAPIFTGGLIAETGTAIAPSHVRIPEAWREVGSVLEREEAEGKVVVLPVADFAEARTTWGYRGPPFARSIIERGVYESQPGMHFHPHERVTSFAKSIETDVLDERSGPVLSKLRALGARYVLLRHDLARPPAGRRLADSTRLARSLRRIPGMTPVADLGLLALYRADVGTPAIFAATPIRYRGPADWIPDALALDERTGLLGSRPSLLDDAAATTQRVVREQRSLRRVSVRAEGGALDIRLSDPVRLGLGGRRLPPLPPRIVRLRNVSSPVLVKVGADYFPVDGVTENWRLLGFAPLAGRMSVGALQLEPEQRGVALRARPLPDCYRTGERTSNDVGLRAELRRDAGSSYLRLAGRDRSACVSLPIHSAGSPVSVTFEYRGPRGSRPRVCLWQDGPDRCAPTRALLPSAAWGVFRETIIPESGTTRVRLLLYADGRGSRETVAEYRKVTVRGFRLIRQVPVLAGGLAEVTRIRAPSRDGIPTTIALGESIPVESASAVGNCALFERRSPEELAFARRVVASPGGRVLQLAARLQSACVRFSIEPFRPNTRHRMHLEYRTVRGLAARACLWQLGAERCTELPALDPSPGWHVLDAEINPDPATVGFVLFLYADGAGYETTVTEFRRLRLGPVSPIALLDLSSADPLPGIRYERTSPSRFIVHVENATRPFLLVATEGYAPGWKLERPDGRGARVEHVAVNGFANGWIVPWSGTYDLTLEYGPERMARAARWSLIAPFALGAAFAARRSRRRLFGTRSR